MVGGGGGGCPARRRGVRVDADGRRGGARRGRSSGDEGAGRGGSHRARERDGSRRGETVCAVARLFRAARPAVDVDHRRGAKVVVTLAKVDEQVWHALEAIE